MSMMVVFYNFTVYKKIPISAELHAIGHKYVRNNQNNISTLKDNILKIVNKDSKKWIIDELKVKNLVNQVDKVYHYENACGILNTVTQHLKRRLRPDQPNLKKLDDPDYLYITKYTEGAQEFDFSVLLKLLDKEITLKTTIAEKVNLKRKILQLFFERFDEPQSNDQESQDQHGDNNGQLLAKRSPECNKDSKKSKRLTRRLLYEQAVNLLVAKLRDPAVSLIKLNAILAGCLKIILKGLVRVFDDSDPRTLKLGSLSVDDFLGFDETIAGKLFVKDVEIGQVGTRIPEFSFKFKDLRKVESKKAGKGKNGLGRGRGRQKEEEELEDSYDDLDIEFKIFGRNSIYCQQKVALNPEFGKKIIQSNKPTKS